MMELHLHAEAVRFWFPAYCDTLVWGTNQTNNHDINEIFIKPELPFDILLFNVQRQLFQAYSGEKVQLYLEKLCQDISSLYKTALYLNSHGRDLMA